ncbi:MAG: hypothetical protein ACO3SP_09370 [Ilumatobacteraceae bacterium]
MSSFTFEPPVFAPAAPRRARRIAPFVLLFGLVIYAAVVMAALTAPQTSDTGGDRAARVVELVNHGAHGVVG